VNLQTVSISIVAEHERKPKKLSLLTGHFINGGFDSAECEPMSDSGFKVLMALVIVCIWMLCKRMVALMNTSTGNRRSERFS
jgi:hypothetical protein